DCRIATEVAHHRTQHRMRHEISAQALIGGQVFADFMGQIRGAAASESLVNITAGQPLSDRCRGLDRPL
ncbi:hypothetical protein ACV54C_004574, partial [Yersinia enterocolitica]